MSLGSVLCRQWAYKAPPFEDFAGFPASVGLLQFFEWGNIGLFSLMPEGSANKTAIASYVSRNSLWLSVHAKRLFALEIDQGGVSLGEKWCCKTSSLWCVVCGHNYLWCGGDSEVSDNIAELLRLQRLPNPPEPKFAGELEAAMHLVERVASQQKPIGQIVLDNLSSAESDLVRAELIKRGAIVYSEAYTNQYGTRMLGLCLWDRQLRQVVDLHALSELYKRVGLESASQDIEAAHNYAYAPLSQWVRSFDWEDNGERGWLTGVLLGYPIWTTVARYFANNKWKHRPRL